MSRVRKLRGSTIALLVPPVLISASGIGYAAWQLGGSGTGAARSSQVTAPTSVTVPGTTVTNGTVAVSWSGATVPAGATPLYFVERVSGATATPACGSTLAAPIAGSSCSDTSVPDGTYNYRVTTRLGDNWKSAATTSASTVTVTAAVALSVSTPDLLAADDSGTSNTDNLTNKTTPTFTGTATAGSSVSILEGATVLGTGTATAGGTYSIAVTAGQALSSSGATGTVHNISAKITSGATAVSPGSLAVTVDTTGPTANAVSTTPTGTAGIFGSGDSIAFTYTEPVAPGALVSGWNGAGTQAITVTLVNGGASQDSVTFGSVPLGTFGLGDMNYKTTAGNSTASANISVSGSVVTVTLTSTPADSAAGGNGSNKSTGTWTSATGATDAAGNAATVSSKSTGNVQLF
jgi:hypothetical protein